MGKVNAAILSSGGGEVAYGSDNPSYLPDQDEKAIANGDRDYDSSDANVTNTRKGSDSVVTDEDDEEEHVRYGWLSFRPGCLQFLNNPKGYLLFLAWFSLVQGMTVNGFIYVNTSTLERRFILPSVQSGSISSCYDFSVMIVIVFVTYLGENSHKPKWLGTGAFIFVLGSIMFMLPHFLTPDYNVSTSLFDTCDPNRPEVGGCTESDGGLSNYFWMFVGAQALHGIGASPLFTIGITYLDDNVPRTLVPIYVGIFQAVSTLGPSIGYLVGGVFLGIWTDVPKEAPGDITEDNPLWVGAWWLGLAMAASLGILMVVPLYGFPKYMKDHKKVARERVEEHQKGTDFQSSQGSGVKGSIKDFPKAIWNLVKNLPFMFINMALVTEWLILASIAAFGPKYIEAQFNINSGNAAILVGFITIPSGILGALIGGFFVKKFKLTFIGQIRLNYISVAISMLLMVGFIFNCPSIKFAGVNADYTNTTLSIDGSSNITSECNIDCQCETRYDPVCGSNNVMYYNSCHAACMNRTTKEGVKTYAECGCVAQDEPADGRLGEAIVGKCTENCTNIWIFAAFVFLMGLFTFIAVVPAITATMRCVSHQQRTVALGVQSLLYRALGTVPGPIIFGSIIDKSCILWEESCSGARQCWFYNNSQMSINVFIFLVCMKFSSVVFYVMSSLTYKPSLTSGITNEERLADGETEKTTDM